MNASRLLPHIAFVAIATLGLPLAAQTFQTQSSLSLAAPAASPFAHGYLGINVGRARNSVSCNASSFLCDERDRPASLYAGTMIGSFWGAEVSYLNTGPLLRDGAQGRAQGLNLSLVGRTRFGSSLGVFGKVGTIYSRSDVSMGGALVMAGDQGFGLSYGAGVSYDFTPRLTARLEWDSHDLHFNGARDSVRSTSLGLQYRY